MRAIENLSREREEGQEKKKKKRRTYENAGCVFFARENATRRNVAGFTGRVVENERDRPPGDAISGIIGDVIGKASTVKGFASAREPFRIFHISLAQSRARDISWKRPIGDLWTISLASRRGHEKRNTILFRYHRCSHYPKRSQYLHFFCSVIARCNRYAVVC